MGAKIVTTTKGKTLDMTRLKLKNQSVIPVSNKTKEPKEEVIQEIPVAQAPKLRGTVVLNAPVTEPVRKAEEKTTKGKK
jgi:hypothetical protein